MEKGHAIDRLFLFVFFFVNHICRLKDRYFLVYDPFPLSLSPSLYFFCDSNKRGKLNRQNWPQRFSLFFLYIFRNVILSHSAESCHLSNVRMRSDSWHHGRPAPIIAAIFHLSIYIYVILRTLEYRVVRLASATVVPSRFGYAGSNDGLRSDNYDVRDN